MLGATAINAAPLKEATVNKKALQKNVKKLISSEAQIQKNKIRGRRFESFVAELGGQAFIEGKDALDFAKSQNRGLGVDPEVRGSINMRGKTRFGDAESGSGHSRDIMTSKIIRELADLGILKSTLSGSSINLNKGGNLFYDIVADGSDKVVKVSKQLGKIYKRAKPETKRSLEKNFGRNGKIDRQTLNKQVNLRYIVDDINPERLKVKKDSELAKRLNKYLEVAKADGFIPNFFGQAINWNKNKSTNQWGLSGKADDLKYFGEYLEEVSKKHPDIVSPKAANKFLTRARSAGTAMQKERTKQRQTVQLALVARGQNIIVE